MYDVVCPGEFPFLHKGNNLHLRVYQSAYDVRCIVLYCSSCCIIADELTPTPNTQGVGNMRHSPIQLCQPHAQLYSTLSASGSTLFNRGGGQN